MKLAALLTTLCLAATLHAQPSPIQPGPTQAGASLLVLSKHDHTLAIVDPSTLKVTARVPVGNDPHEVIASTDGSTAYVSNYGFGAYNTLAVVDLVHQRALAPIDLGPLRGPHGLTFVGGKTWFTAEAAKAIARYDPATQKVDWILGTGQNRTHMIYVFPDVNPDVQRILTTNVGSGTVSLIQKEPVRMPGPPPGMRPPGALGSAPPPPPSGVTQRVDWNQTVIPVGRGAEGFDVSPDQREAWVANARDGTISVIDLAAKEVVDTVAANVPSANRLKFTPDGRRVLVSSLSGPDLVILDSATRREVKRLPIGHGAAGIEIEPGGARAFVACTPDNYVTVIDLHSLAVVGKIDAGPEPDGLAWAVRRSTP
jgi:YVTN family beta-propeller protein